MQILEKMGERAVAAKYSLQVLSEEEKNKALTAAAEGLLKDTQKILDANEKDMQAGR